MRRERTRSGERFVVAGAGPAGLGAALELTRHGERPLVLESLDQVGGLARTERYQGYRFDLGGHRFFTKNRRVQSLWEDVLGADFLLRPRLSRIYYQGRYFSYPLRPGEVLTGLGIMESTRIILSYVASQLFPHRPEETFEQWVTNRFGRRLFRTFFQAYTEKVWGISCSELKAEWAAQRIQDLSVRSVLAAMLAGGRTGIRSLIEEFHYPRLGPGMMWEAFRARIEAAGGEVRTGCPVRRVEREGDRITAVWTGSAGDEQRIPAAALISSLPITDLVRRLSPAAPAPVREAAERLRYRDFLIVCLIVDRETLFPDNWVYVHDPSVRVARVQNFKNWSPELVPDPKRTSLGMEYFCQEGDALWSMPDTELIELARQEAAATGLALAGEVVDGCVVRVPKAYPVYASDYAAQLSTLREYVESLRNCWTVGRNGLHRYNNQDHAVLTGILAARMAALGEEHDLWSVNADRDYLESMRVSN